MKLFEQHIKEMTLEKLVQLNVKLVNINNRKLFWVTSSGQLFSYEDYTSALQYEKLYLEQEVKVPEVKETVE